MKKSLVFIVFALLLVIFAGSSNDCIAQEAEEMFRKGLVKEEGEGQLEEAIDIYNKIQENATAGRNLRAKALLHVALCYEKLGEEKATEVYRKLISDFADQEDLVEISRKKLSAITSKSETTLTKGIVFEELWPDAEDVYGASPDGRYLNYIDWKTIELAVKDLVTGKTWELTNTGTWRPPMKFPDKSIWSPDSKKLAYYWFNGDTSELHIINLDGSSDRIISKYKGNNTPWPLDWTVDGKYILAIQDTRDESEELKPYGWIVLVSVDNGSVKKLYEIEGLQPEGTGVVSPDNKYFVMALQQSQESLDNDIMIGALDGTFFRKLVADDADDRCPILNPDGDRVLFMSNRLGTNDLWSLKVEEGKPAGAPRIEMSNMGRTILYRVTNDEELYYFSSHFRTDIIKTSINFRTSEVLSGSGRISDLDDERNFNPSWSPDGRHILYQVYPNFYDQDIGRRFILVVYDTETGEKKKLTTDFYGQVGNYWNMPRWNYDSRNIIIQAKYPKEMKQGFYLVDAVTGEPKPLYITDLATSDEDVHVGYFPMVTKNGKDLIYVTPDRKKIIRRNIDSGKEKVILSGEDELLYYSLSPDEDEIAFGYFFNNRNALFLVRESDGSVKKLADFEKGVTPYTIGWTSDGNEILFENGAWGEGDHSILRISKNGGDPVKVIGISDLFPQGEVRTIEVHPDGEQVLFDVSSGKNSEVWSMKNLFRKEN